MATYAPQQVITEMNKLQAPIGLSGARDLPVLTLSHEWLLQPELSCFDTPHYSLHPLLRLKKAFNY